MKTITKLVMSGPDDKYLLMYRNEHPLYGTDPDLPGGIQEKGETSLEAVLREVQEETGVVIDAHLVHEVYRGSEYSEHGTEYVLFTARVPVRSKIVMSWEHSSYEWIPLAKFLEKSKAANDTYMHMAAHAVHDNAARAAADVS